jgi:hypothetical protein
LKELWDKIEPRNYSYTISASALVQSFMIAFVARLSGLRAVTARCYHLLHTHNFSSLSPALQRASSLAFVKAMVGFLETTHQPGKDELVGIDGMAVTFAKTRRHKCKKYNDKTVGGGVVWTYMINAAQGVSPVKVLKIIEGAWHDSKVMRTIALIPKGPIYLMDRGFYALALVQKWLDEKVRFIVRVRERSLVYTVVRTVSNRRKIDDKRLILDAIVRLGGQQAKTHPVVRMVIAILPSGEKLILATDRMKWSAERILAAYHKRWHIERFHRFLKDTLGLAHLYSFGQSGITFLLYTALLLALLLFFAETDPTGETIKILRGMLTAVRRALGLGTPWKRNMYAPRRTKKKSTKKTRENH